MTSPSFNLGQVPLCHCPCPRSEPLQTFGFLTSTFCCHFCHLTSTGQRAQALRNVHSQCLSAELHIQVQILSPRLRFWAGKLTAGAGSENAPVAHLLPASFAIRRGKQSSVLVFLGRLLEVFTDTEGIKAHKTKTTIHMCFPRDKISGELPSSWGFSLPPLMLVRGQNLSGLVLGNTCKYIHVLCWWDMLLDVQFPQLSEQGSQWEKLFQKCWSLTRRVSYSNSLPRRQARVASQLAAKF